MSRNGYIESFNGKFKDEFLNREVLDTVLEARVLTARCRRYYNAERPHRALGYRPPAPEAIMPAPVEPEIAAQRSLAPRGGGLDGLPSGVESL